MKQFAVILCFALAVFAQEDHIDTTEDLLQAQNELTMGHEFTEIMLQVNRNIISSYIEIVQEQLIDSFMDSYSELQMLFDDTTAELAEFESNNCVDNIVARWELQATRYGSRLSQCLTSSVAEIMNWNKIINEIHSTSQFTTTTQIPNAAAAVLAETIDFITPARLSSGINSRFRDLLFRGRKYLESFEEFRASVVDNEEEIINELTQCDRSLVAAFNNEARDDLARARRCLET